MLCPNCGHPMTRTKLVAGRNLDIFKFMCPYCKYSMMFNTTDPHQLAEIEKL